MYTVWLSCMLLYNAIGRNIPGRITVMESDNENTARRIAIWDRMSGFSQMHITKMFEITVSTSNDENTAKYHTGNSLGMMNAIFYAQVPPTAEIRPVVLTQCSKDKNQHHKYGQLWSHSDVKRKRYILLQTYIYAFMTV